MHTGKLIRFGIIAILVTVLLSPACGFIKRKSTTRQYFIVSYAPDVMPPPGSQRPYPYALQIGRFEVQRIFNRQNIIYRYSPNRIQFYDIERWAVRPDYMMRDMIFKHFESVNLTNFVAMDFLENRPDFRLEGTVEALEKYDAGDVFYAHLAMTYKMLRIRDSQQVWSYSFDERRRVYSPEMVQTVVGLSAILQTHMNTIVGQLDSLFLSYNTGIPYSPATSSAQSARTDSAKTDSDDSGYIIIPEKKP